VLRRHSGGAGMMKGQWLRQVSISHFHPQGQ
jgi:hypothetical protein